MKHLAALLAVVLSSSIAPAAQAPRPAAPPLERPKLVVLISVDQMRGDYVDRFRHQWSKGLHRLLTEGAYFPQTDYPYYTTVTCPGHASISTGTVPAVHGMVSNTWAVQNNSRTVSCTDDDQYQLISYGAPVTGVGHSAANLKSPTLADEMRAQLWPATRVIGLSLKARSAINLSGHRPDVVAWLDEGDGEWVTSTAFAKAPAPFLARYITEHPLRAQIGQPWDRALPKHRYVYAESSEGRRRTPHATTAFPHVVRGRGDETRGAVTDAWEASPYSDQYLAALAASSIDALHLGRDGATDFIGISFSALDAVGHSYGPASHEVQDILIRLDETIGVLLDKLDRDLGKGRYVVGLSSDHGVAPVPDRMKALGFDAGRLDTAGMARAIDAVLLRELGAAAYRTRVLGNDIYFNDGVYQKLAANPAAMEQVLNAVRSIEGVWRVYRKEELSATDPLTRASFLSYYEGRSGQVKFLGRPYWLAAQTTSTHGTGHRYDTRVPLLLFGYGIRKGEYLAPSAPIDVAPTLAFLVGVTLPDAMGRVLTEALLHR